MTDHPLLFRGEMVQALLDGRKTQTRRPAWRNADKGPGALAFVPTAAQRIKVGDLVWVRETHSFPDEHAGEMCVAYKADGDKAPYWWIRAPRTDYERLTGAGFDNKSRPSIHMPRWASRITLAVTGARVERLQAISREDAKAEGVRGDSNSKFGFVVPGTDIDAHSYRGAYMLLYQSIHGRDAWDANPEVVVLTFTVHKANIDAFKREAAA